MPRMGIVLRRIASTVGFSGDEAGGSAGEGVGDAGGDQSDGVIEVDGRALDLDWVKKRIAYWSEIIRVQDWTIRIKVLREFEMKNSNCWAYIERYRPKRQATLALLHPIDYGNEAFDDLEADPELSILHELLHLRFDPFENFCGDEKEDRELAEEQVVHDLATALLKLDRQS